MLCCLVSSDTLLSYCLNYVSFISLGFVTMESLINIQKHIQRSIEKSLVNFEKYLNDKLTYEYIETRLDNLEKDWNVFRENNQRLYEISEPNELDKSIYITQEVYDCTEENYLNCKCQMKTKLKELSLKTNVTNSVQTSSSQHVKLPKITIPMFSGKYSEWITFRDLFISLIHKNGSLSDVQKLHYLKSYLVGEAEQLIRHTPISDVNYLQCWSQLEKRYNNKRYHANNILKRLFNQPSISSECSSGLKELLDTTTDCLNALQNLGIDVTTWDLIIIHIITNKFDVETRKEWELSVSNNGFNQLPTYEDLKLFLESHFRALEFLEPRTLQNLTNNIEPNQTIKSFFVSNNNNNPLPCEFCSEIHKLCFCKKFAKRNTEFRREFVLKNKLCFNCLGRNHLVYNCKKNSSCRICHKRHHSLLHQNTSMNSSDKNVASNLNKLEIMKPSITSENSPMVSCFSTEQITNSRPVLLATTVIQTESEPGKVHTTRALIDQGSQVSFITESLVQKLGLKMIPTQSTVLGIENKTIKFKYMVYLTIQSRIDPKYKFKIKAYVLPNIISYIPEKMVKSLNWNEIKTLPLADPDFDTASSIDILLGTDVYSLILHEGLKKSASGNLIAQNTAFGWILSGVAL